MNQAEITQTWRSETDYGLCTRKFATGVRLRIVCYVITAIVSGMALPAGANTVTGRVVGASGTFPPRGCFMIDGRQQVCTDAQRTFSVFLSLQGRTRPSSRIAMERSGEGSFQRPLSPCTKIST